MRFRLIPEMSTKFTVQIRQRPSSVGNQLMQLNYVGNLPSGIRFALRQHQPFLGNSVSIIRLVKRSTLIAALTIASHGNAAQIAFVPPVDTVGKAYAGPSGGLNNDGWTEGRGIGFDVTSTQTISSIGLYSNLTNVSLTYGIYTISAPAQSNPVVTEQPIDELSTLASGGSVVTTNGLQWIDYSIGPITLSPGTNYLIQFAFSAPGNQSYYYDSNFMTWTQGPFIDLDGEAPLSPEEGSVPAFDNFLTPAIRVTTVDNVAPAAVPEPETITLLGIALIAFATMSRRSGRKTSLRLK